MRPSRRNTLRLTMQEPQRAVLALAADQLQLAHRGRLVEALAPVIAQVAGSRERQRLESLLREAGALIAVRSGGDIHHPSMPDDARTAADLAATLRLEPGAVLGDPVGREPAATLERMSHAHAAATPRVVLRDDHDG